MADLWTLVEVGDYLRVSRRTVERLIDRGDLPSLLVGHQRRVRRRDVIAYVASATRRRKIA